jgi:serine O-acetyltransferase
MIFKRLKEEVDAFVARDPAARSRLEVALCYPGFHAVLLHRVAHQLWKRGFCLAARMISQFSRLVTGIEIHPGARIGRRLVIDHGQGVVIGETSEIADDVTLYQGVTLGGIAPSVDSRNQVNVKRHPTLQAGVILGSGAQILGPVVVGEAARVGANSVVTRDVPPGVSAVGIPAHVMMPKDRTETGRFSAYGTPAGGCPDPIVASIENLRSQIADLIQRCAALEQRVREMEDEQSVPDALEKRGAGAIAIRGDKAHG